MWRPWELQGLVGAAVSDFVDVLVGTRSSTAAVRAELSERTDGTPLFLEEMVRSLADVGVLSGESGKYKLGETDFRGGDAGRGASSDRQSH